MGKKWLAAILISFALAASGSLAAATSKTPAEVVAAESASNMATAENDLGHRLGMIRLPAGAVATPGRPSGVGEHLSGPSVEPGGGRFVHSFAFWTLPEPQRQVLDFLRHHPPSGARVGSEFSGSGGPGVEFDWRHPPEGIWDVSVILTVVKRTGGGSAVRADAWDWWELPRSPAARIAGQPHYLVLRVMPTGEGIPLPVEEGEPEPPPPVPRFNSTARRSVIATVLRLVERQPAYQITSLPSCGPPAVGETDLIELVFKDRRGGKVLATVSQNSPIGPCDPLMLHPAGGGRYALEFGWNVLQRVHGLIQSAKPRAAGQS